MATLTFTEKAKKFTPTKAENQYFLRGDEKNMLISMERKAGDAVITGMGARSTLKSVSKGDLVWIAKIVPAKVDKEKSSFLLILLWYRNVLQSLECKETALKKCAEVAPYTIANQKGWRRLSSPGV
eukprot:g65165.t1